MKFKSKCKTFYDNASEKIVCEIAAILSSGRQVNSPTGYSTTHGKDLEPCLNIKTINVGMVIPVTMMRRILQPLSFYTGNSYIDQTASSCWSGQIKKKQKKLAAWNPEISRLFFIFKDDLFEDGHWFFQKLQIEIPGWYKWGLITIQHCPTSRIWHDIACNNWGWM